MMIIFDKNLKDSKGKEIIEIYIKAIKNNTLLENASFRFIGVPVGNSRINRTICFLRLDNGTQAYVSNNNVHPTMSAKSFSYSVKCVEKLMEQADKIEMTTF